MKNSKRRGFTLVELLIVIVVIGILSAMMMLSSTEAVSSAKANNIISNLRNLKTAALAVYVDSLDYVNSTPLTDSNKDTYFTAVKRHLGNQNDTQITGYSLVPGTTNSEWYLEYTGVDANVGAKLKGRAESVGLLSGKTKATGTGNSATGYYGGTGNVYMFVR